MTTTAIQRETVDVDGAPASFLTAGDGPLVLLLHGTYWSRVWQTAIAPLAAAGLRPVAVDLPGCGRSGGELTIERATVPELTAWVERFLDALGATAPLRVAGHDIGGALAQRLTVRGRRTVRRLALVNGVTYDSWPVPGVAKYRDPAVVAATTPDELVAARRTALTAAVGRPIEDDEIAEYLSPWSDLRVARSWMALAGAADPRYTLELVDDLIAVAAPTLLLWGEDDAFQRVEFAERYAAEIPHATLRRLPGSGHIPMESAPDDTADALVRWFAS
jgi:pimeloyl-ACP methyl ester carboxylesterase